jgi:ABC-type multidrug transport system ATPase subunit
MEATDTSEHVIEVTDLRRVYGGGFEAVRGVTFHVDRGETFALLGTNGTGKTSTVELLEGLAPPDGGRVRVLGHDPYTERAAVRPRTGVMLQEGGFPSELTVGETARMWAGCVSGARPVREALAPVGLERRTDVRVKQLSGGERRRLDLALALLGEPEVLFLDEPTTGLDAEGRRDTWELVRTLRDGGTTVLLTTHYLEEAELAVQLGRRGRPEAVEQMIEVQRLAQESQREVRAVVRGYREADLAAELAGARGVLAAAGIDCTVTGSPAGLPAPVQSALGWVVREAATNVLRHGDARQCAVSLRVADGRAELSVENDGVREASGGDRPGSGLAGLRERLSELDGTLRAGPAGRGRFRLTAEVPLPPAAGPVAARPTIEVTA